jgi:hypothetical protein
MSAVTVWLLIAFNYGSSAGAPSVLLERFPTVHECERVKAIINAESEHRKYRCIQATVMR